MVMDEDRKTALDLHHKGCPAAISYTLDARSAGGRGYNRALLLGLVPPARIRYPAGRYPMGTSMVWEQIHTRAGREIGKLDNRRER